MSRPLRVLMVEDQPDDAELVMRELRRAGFEPGYQRVECEADFSAALADRPDIVLSDFLMPRFSGLRALEILKSQELEIPFILISGTIGEDLAVQAMKEGASDYLLKDRLGRLGPAVEHALEESRLRLERERSDERFRRLVDSNAQGVMFRKSSGEIIGANDAFLKMVGYSREDLEAGLLNWLTMTPPEFARADRRCQEELAASAVCKPYEKEFIRKDGSRVPVLVGVAAFEYDPDEGVCFVIDLTERRKLEQQFLRSQRMEAIGSLAGGIAHDFNNVLAPIMMAVSVLKGRLPDASSQELLEILSASAKHGSDMVSQVLLFAAGTEDQRQVTVKVRHLLLETEKIVTDTFLKNIGVMADIPEDLWTVTGDPTQLHQVVLNLCVNARDAMPNGGTLAIKAENRQLDEHDAGLNPEAAAGPYVVLHIKDSGSGIPPELLEKIFDPFFTTKEVSKGTGLGLSTTLGIVKNHGGFIRVHSEPGKGTEFEVYLPANRSAEVEADDDFSAELPPGEDELILVVDDEEGVREVTRHTLEAFGYRVLLAADGAEAVAVFARHVDEVDVVLTDMTMPVMDGAATIQVLKRMAPEVRVIAASGLPSHGDPALMERLGVCHFLPKPYTAETLLKALREVLSAAPSKLSTD